MKAKKLRDLLIGCFLVSTLGLAGILVSCSERDGGLIVDSGNNSYNPYIAADEESSVAGTLLLALGRGAAQGAGNEMMGWALGALGLSSASGPDYGNQLSRISNELDSAVSLLGTATYQLGEIINILNNINCGAQQSSLLDQITVIKDRNQELQSLLQSVTTYNDTLTVEEMKDWSDKVLAINNYTSYISISSALNAIETNLETSSGAINACIPTITKPANGSFGQDTTYYRQVNYFVNYYYFYQTLALSIISEAYHFYAWYEAGQPGGSFTSADSIQLVCSHNGNSQYYCNQASNAVNTLYNNLIKQVKDGGAPYTSQYLVYQQIDENNSYVWIKSLEDYSTQSGHNCGSILTNFIPCASVSGYYYSKIGDSVYRYAMPFKFANATQLRNLIDVTQVSSGMSNGNYLQSKGFHNMLNKTFIAADTVAVQFDHMINPYVEYVVPFFNTDISPSNLGMISVYLTSNDFRTVLPSRYESNRNDHCGFDNYHTSWLYHYSTNSTLVDADSWTLGYAKERLCGDNTYVIPFEWTDHNYNGSDCCYPGFLALKQRLSGTPKRFLMPVLLPNNAICTSRSSPLISGGMPSMCHQNFTNFLISKVPRPETCDMKNPAIICVQL